MGRPRKDAPPVTELGIPNQQTGNMINALNGRVVPWSEFVDEEEYVPEMMWPTSVGTFSQMRTDTQVSGLYYGTSLPIRQFRWMIDPNDARPEMVDGIARDFNLPVKGQDAAPRRRMKRRFSHAKHMQNAMLALIYGHMYFEQVGEIGDDGLWHLRKLAPRMPHTIQSILVADDGGLVSIKQWGRSRIRGASAWEQPEIPVDRLAAYVFEQEGAAWDGRSMLRDCYKNWLIKDRLMRVDAVNHERAGGVPYATAPMGATTAELAALNQMAQRFRIGESSGAALPYGAELHIARGTDSNVVNSIRYHDESMARRFLMMLMQLGQTTTGSRALGETFLDFFSMGLEAIAEWYKDVTNEHVIEDWVDWNFDLPEDEPVPLLTYERREDDQFGIDQLVSLVDSGVIVVDKEIEDQMRDRYGVAGKGKVRKEIQAPAPSGGPSPAPAPATKEPVAARAADAVAVGAPSQPQTSRLRRIFRRSGETVAAAAPNLVTLANVPIVSAGIEYQLSTGPATFTPEDLYDAVTASNEDIAIGAPRLKISRSPNGTPHATDITDILNEPSFGKATNMRLGDGGMTIYADYVGVPKWLADIMPAAYPNRSIEGAYSVETVTGKKWKFVITAVELLGIHWPGVSILEDLPLYYGDEIPEGVVIVEAGGEPMKLGRTAAVVNLDDVRRSFYTEYISADGARRSWWVRAILVDPNELIVEDDDDGQLYRVAFASKDDQVTFGDPVPVKIKYVDDKQDKTAANLMLVAGMAVHAKQATTYDTRAASSPETPTQGGQMDPAEIRRRLGLPETATDPEVRQALGELNTAAGVEVVQPQAVPPYDATGTTTPSTRQGLPEVQVPSTGNADNDNLQEPVPPGAQPPANSEGGNQPNPSPGAQHPANAQASVVQVDAATWEETRRGAELARTMHSQNVERENTALVTAAVADGRIPPARREAWLQALNGPDREGHRQALASLAPGLIPIEARGSNANDGNTQTEEAYPSGWFPEIAANREQIEKRSGAFPRIHVEA